MKKVLLQVNEDELMVVVVEEEAVESMKEN
jgi:hypothetical protein